MRIKIGCGSGLVSGDLYLIICYAAGEMGFRTIKENERVLIFNQDGSGRVVAGPRRVSLLLFTVAQ